MLWKVFIYSFYRCKHVSFPPAVMLHCHCSAVPISTGDPAAPPWVRACVRQKPSTRSSRLLSAEHPAQSRRLCDGGGGLFREASFSLTEPSQHLRSSHLDASRLHARVGACSQGNLAVSRSVHILYSVFRTRRANAGRIRASVLIDFTHVVFPERERESEHREEVPALMHRSSSAPPPLSDPRIHTRFRAIDVAARSTLIPSATIP